VSALLVSVAVVVTGVLVLVGGFVDHRGLGSARCKPFSPEQGYYAVTSTTR
jgi:hypothetical protein